jgi:hypothetical protein
MSGRVPPPYPPEVRLEAVRLVREGGVSLKDAAATAGCSIQTMRNRPVPAIGGLDDHVTTIGRCTHFLGEPDRVIVDADAVDLLACFVHPIDHRTPSVQVDADVLFTHRGLPSCGTAVQAQSRS